VKGWKKTYQPNGPQKWAGVAILILDKVDFKSTLIKRDEEGYSILKRGNTPKGNNNYQPICPQHQCTQLHQTYSKDLKTYINSNTVVVGEFNIPLSPIHRSSK
jgi:hypothetical protein